MLRSALARHTFDATSVEIDALRATVADDHQVADSAHDVSHLDRVAELSAMIAEQIGADPMVAKVAGYVHDYHRVAEARTGVRPLPVHAANDLVRAVLDAHRIPRRWYPDILCAVDATGRYRIAGDLLPADLAEVCPVAAAVHDADNLDALGVIGLARAVGYGAVLGEPLWAPEAALQSRYTEGQTSSVVAHCYEKLVHLADEMLTEPGRRQAELRLAELFGVLGRLRAELVATPVPGTDWDPRTGYLRVPLQSAPAGAHCRLEFTAGVRLALRSGRDGTTVCYVELYALPAVATAILNDTALNDTAGAARPIEAGDALRIPIRPSDADQFVAGQAAVQLELTGTLATAITLHLRDRGVDLDHR